MKRFWHGFCIFLAIMVVCHLVGSQHFWPNSCTLFVFFFCFFFFFFSFLLFLLRLGGGGDERFSVVSVTLSFSFSLKVLNSYIHSYFFFSSFNLLIFSITGRLACSLTAYYIFKCKNTACKLQRKLQ